MRILFFLVALLLSTASAWPGNPGTCDVEKMSREGHGPSKSACKDCYSITSSIATDYLSYSLKVTGREQFQGFLLYVQDAANNTVGSFRTYDRFLYQPVECQEAIEFDLNNTIGHSNPIMKRWPVEVGWTAAVTEDEAAKFQPGDKLTVRGMVVMDYDHWHIFPEFTFSIAQPGAEKLKLPTVHDTIPTHHHEYPNKLFYTVLVIAFVIYNGMSLLFKHLQRRRRQTREKQTTFQATGDRSILLRDW